MLVVTVNRERINNTNSSISIVAVTKAAEAIIAVVLAVTEVVVATVIAARSNCNGGHSFFLACNEDFGGECFTIHCPPALNPHEVEIISGTLIPHFYATISP